MGTLKIRYLETRTLADGSEAYYWKNRHARDAGLENEALGNDPAVAATRATELNALWDAVRAGKQPSTAPAPTGTVGWLIREIRASDTHKQRNAEIDPTTVAETDWAWDIILKSPISSTLLTAVNGEGAELFHLKLRQSGKYNVDQAHRIMKWFKYLMGRAKWKGLLPASPLLGQKFERAPARHVYWDEEEVTAIVAKATEMGRRSIGLASQAAFDTGQREMDVLSFLWKPPANELQPGTFRFPTWDRGDILLKQRKTGAVVRVPALPELRKLIELTPQDGIYMILSETTRRPYKIHNFGHLFREICDAAGIPEKRFADFRRSACLRLARAGCDVLTIGSVTGHSYETIEKILEVYLPRTTALARIAIEKVLEARARQKQAGLSAPEAQYITP